MHCAVCEAGTLRTECVRSLPNLGCVSGPDADTLSCARVHKGTGARLWRCGTALFLAAGSLNFLLSSCVIAHIMARQVCRRRRCGHLGRRVHRSGPECGIHAEFALHQAR